MSYALNVTLQTTECTATQGTGNLFKMVVMITFKLGIGFNIEEDIKTKVANNSLPAVPADRSRVEVAFIGI